MCSYFNSVNVEGNACYVYANVFILMLGLFGVSGQLVVSLENY